VDRLRVATALVMTGRSSLTAILEAEAATAGAPTMGPTGELGAVATAVAEATRIATSPAPHVAASMPTRKSKNYNRRQRRLPCLLCATSQPTLPEKFKPLGITKYDAKQDPVQWLRCYALSIENAGGNNDTKCLYFPFCLDQAPLTWLESLEKYSIDKWDQLKEQFTSNFAGAMGRSSTHMDLAMVK
jgi:hypothetical protein